MHSTKTPAIERGVRAVASTGPASADAAARDGGLSGRLLWRPVAIYAASRFMLAMIVVVSNTIRPDVSISDMFGRWDGGWYVAAARHGYPHLLPIANGRLLPSTLAFFPLLPIAMRAVHALTGLSWVNSGVAVTTLFGLGFTVALWSLVRHIQDAEVADRATALACFFPGFLVFGLIYTEPLSLFFSVICLYALMQRKWLLAGAAAALATAAHPDAIILLACCAWSAGIAIWKQRDWRALIAPALAPAGIVAFFTYLKFHAGGFRTYINAARTYGWDDRISPLHWTTLLHALWGSHSGDPNFVVPGLGVIFVMVTIPMLLRSHYPTVVVIYGVVVGLLYLVTSLGPRPRFVLVAFPLIVVLAHRVRGFGFAALLACSATALGAVGVLTLVTTGLVP